MQIIRLICDTIKGTTFVPFVRYPATEEDKTDAIMDYGKFSNNPVYINWRIELCEGNVVDDEIVIDSIIKTWELPLE